jgi:hypothetical protein
MGFCDRKRGICVCDSSYSSASNYGLDDTPGNRGDCGWYSGLQQKQMKTQDELNIEGLMSHFNNDN